MSSKSQRINHFHIRGQGTLEFVLLIVVAVTLVLALASQFFKPFKKYADYYLGSYVECLLDEGELPTLGNEGSTLDCGTPPSDFANAAAAEAAAAKSNAANASKNADAAKSAGNKNGNSGGSGNLVSNDGKSFRSVSGSGSDGAAGGENSTKNESSSSKGSKFYRALGSNEEIIIHRKKTQDFEVSQLSESARAQVEKAAAPTSTVLESSSEISSQSKRMALKNSARDVASADSQEEEWSFGKIFRIVIIILVLIALFLVVGGQLNQIRKGSEK